MKSLLTDLQTSKSSLTEFFQLTIRVLEYLPSVISDQIDTTEYVILISTHSNSRKYTRPIRKCLFIQKASVFKKESKEFLNILKTIKSNHNVPNNSAEVIDRVAYTIQQSIGVGLDLLGEANSSRKHVGCRFEELIHIITSSVGVNRQKMTFKIPYSAENGDKQFYSCETDMVLSSEKKIKSTANYIDEKEVIVSLKTSSKDRMGKIFLDKILMQQFSKHPVKVIGIFHNDVQRKEDKGIAYTFVSGLFMVYTEFLCKLEGVYFLDPPATASKPPYSEHIFTFSKFVLEDIKTLLIS